MVVQIAWAITGAGHFLEETFDVMSRLRQSDKVQVTAFLSSAGEQVVKRYGFWNKLQQISSGGYLQEIFTENSEDLGFSRAGRLMLGMYDLLFVSPASANTVAKIVYGIADTLVTNAVAQAQKGEVPVYVVPTDQKEGTVETTLPTRVDQRNCKRCSQCPVVEACSYGAVKILDGVPRIDSPLCQGCGSCVVSCQFGAVKANEKKSLRIRNIDVQNVKRLQSIEDFTVLESPKQIETVIEKV